VLVFVLLGQVLPAEWRVPGLGKTPVAAAEPVAPPAAVVPERTVRQVSDSGPTVVSGRLAKDTVWGPVGSPYVIRDDFAVPEGVALTLLPGTVVKFDGQFARISVSGQLISLGRPGRTVVFTSYRDDGVLGDSNGDGAASAPARGDWYSIFFFGKSVGVLDYTDVHFGGYGSGGGFCSSYGSLTVNSGAARVVVSNSLFTDAMSSGISGGDAGSANGYLGVYNSRFRSSYCGVSVSQAVAQIVGNDFDATLSNYAFFALYPSKVRFWFNTARASVDAVGSAPDGGPPTRAQADVRYNALLAKAGGWLPSQDLTDWSGNWWGRDVNTDLVSACVSMDQASASSPALVTVYDWACPGSTPYRAVRYDRRMLPALSSSLGQVPAALVEAAAPMFGPVDTVRGRLTYQAMDLGVDDAGHALTATRTYRSDSTGVAEAGRGWTVSYSEALSAGPNGVATLTTADGARVPFGTDAALGYAPAPGVAAGYASSQSGTTITGSDRTAYQFNPAGELTGLTLGDPGHQVRVDRAGGTVSQVVGTSDRRLAYTRGDDGRIEHVSDGTGRSTSYQYDAGRLASVTGVDGKPESYTYDAQGRLTAVTSPDGVVTLAAEYDDQGRVQWLEQAGSGRARFDYGDGLSTVTLPDGRVIEQHTDANGRLVVESLRGGSGRHVIYDAEGRTVAVINGVPDGPMVGYSAPATIGVFDQSGDQIITVDPAGATTLTSFVNHRPVRTVRPDGTLITRSFDPDGRLRSVTDPAGGVWSYTTNGRGQVTEQTDPLGRGRSVAYTTAGDLESSTDETGARTTYATDERGWVTATTDPAGATTRIEYTPWGQTTRVTDPLGAVTAEGFDADRRRTSRTDANGKVTRYAYDDSGRLESSTDPVGGVTRYGYDSSGRQVTVTDPAGGKIRQSWGEDGYLETVTDQVGAVTRMGYDPAGRQIQATDPEGRVTVRVTDRAGRTTALLTPDGAKATTDFDLLGRPTKQVTAGGAVTTASYDPAGRLAAMVDPLGGKTQFGYNLAGRVATVTDPSGNTTRVGYDDATRTTTTTDLLGVVGAQTLDAAGRVTAVTDPAGAVTRYTLDAVGRTTAVTDPLGATHRYEYDLVGNVTADVDALGRRTTISYDALNRAERVTGPDGASSHDTFDQLGNLVTRTSAGGRTTNYAYDAAGRVTAVTDPASNTTRYALDSLGRVTTVTDPTGVVTRFGYDPMGRIAVRSDATGASWVTSYTPDGYVSGTRDPDGVIHTYTRNRAGQVLTDKWNTTSYQYTYDAAGRMLTRVDPYTTRYAYDARDRLTTVTDGVGKTTSYGYDAADRLKTTTSPSGATWTLSYDAAGQLTVAADPLGNTSRYGYDPAGQQTSIILPAGGAYTTEFSPTGLVAAQTNPAGATTRFGYDPDGQLTSTVYPTGRTVTHSYDPAGRRTASTAGDQHRNYTYDNAGRPLRATAADGTSIAYTYNELGQLASTTDPVGSGSYTYTPAGRPASHTGPGASSTYRYDARGLLSAVSGTVNYTFTRNSAGQVTRRSAVSPTRPGGLTLEYDAAGRVTKRIAANPDSANYTYAPDGQLATITNPVDTSGIVYGYDAAGRLTSATTKTGDTVTATSGYTHDPDGNQLSVTTSPTPAGQPTTVTTSYNLADQPVRSSDGTTYTFSEDGDLRTVTGGPEGTTTYTYDPFGAPETATTSSEQISYTSDALDRTATRTTGPTIERLSYTPGGELTAVATGARVTALIRQPDDDTLLALAPTGANPQAAVTNHHGDLIALRDAATSAQTYRTSYDATGNPQNSTGTSPIPLGYQGDYTDPATGLVDMGARWYQPTTSSFTSVDTLAGDPTQPTSLNRYLYGNADPVGHIDPDGHWPKILSRIGNWLSNAAGAAGNALGSAASSVDQATKPLRQAVTSAASGAATYVGENRQQIKAAVASIAVGAVVGAACGIVTGGVGSVGCLAAAGAAGGAVYNMMTCPPGASTTSCAVTGAAVGAVGGASFGLAAAAGAGAVSAGAFAGAASSATGQYLTTGTINPRQLAVDTALGGALGLLGGARRSTRTSRPTTTSASRSVAPSRAARSGGPATDQLTAIGKLRNITGKSCPTPHSFTPDTPVLMADRTTKPIKDVTVGDTVTATDPATGVTSGREVTAHHTNQDTDLTDLTITTETGSTETIHTTQHHPFWNSTTSEWTDASQLKPGDRLHTPTGQQVTVTGVTNHTGDQPMNDLTIATTHTYYVIAGTTPVLVHNCGESKWTPDENYSPEAVASRSAANKAFYSVPRDTHELVNMLEANPNMSPRLNPNGSVDTFQGNNLSGPARRYWDSWIGSPIYWNGRPGSQIRIMRNQTTGQVAHFPLTREGVHNYGSPTLYNW
jgi:RHS repeat-associated protein